MTSKKHEIPKNHTSTPSERSLEEVQRLREEAIAREEARLAREQLKASRWTAEDLQVLTGTKKDRDKMLTELSPKELRGIYKIVTGGDTEELASIRAEQVILDGRRGEPRELAADLKRVFELAAKKNIVLEKNGKVERKEPLGQSAEFVDLLYGAVITYHILGEGFYITRDRDGKILLRDNHTPERTEQMKALQDAFLNTANIHWPNDVFMPDDRNPAKTVAVSKVDTAVASMAYYLSPENNLIQHRKALEEKIFPGNPNKPITRQDIENKNMPAGDKTFLLAWYGGKKDLGLERIQDKQKKSVEEVTAHPGYHSLKSKLLQYAENPTKAVAPAMGALIGISLLIAGFKMMFGKESSIWKRMLGGIAVFGGLAFGRNFINTFWDLTGAGAMLREQIQGHPSMTGSGNGDVHDAWDPTWSERVDRVMANFSGGAEYKKIIFKKDIQGLIGSYPAWKILTGMHPGKKNAYNEHGNRTLKPDEAKNIGKKLDALKAPDRIKLEKMLKEVWDKNVAIGNTENLKTDTFQDMVGALDADEGFLDHPLDWTGQVHLQDEKDTTMEFARYPNAWSNVRIGELMRFWYGNHDRDPWKNIEIKPETRALIGAIGTDRYAGVRNTIQRIWDDQGMIKSPDTTLGKLTNPDGKNMLDGNTPSPITDTDLPENMETTKLDALIDAAFDNTIIADPLSTKIGQVASTGNSNVDEVIDKIRTYDAYEAAKADLLIPYTPKGTLSVIEYCYRTNPEKVEKKIQDTTREFLRAYGTNTCSEGLGINTKEFKDITLLGFIGDTARHDLPMPSSIIPSVNIDLSKIPLVRGKFDTPSVPTPPSLKPAYERSDDLDTNGIKNATLIGRYIRFYLEKHGEDEKKTLQEFVDGE